MRRFAAVFVLVGLAGSTVRAEHHEDSLPPTPDGKAWKLVWHDEFDGTKLDESKWTYRPDGKRKGGWWSRKAITFGLLWLPDEYIFYVDGKETWRSKTGGVCQVPQYMLLSDEIGSWAGDISRAKLPDRFLVDYVRVYDLTDGE